MRKRLKGMLRSAVCAVLLASVLLGVGLLSGFPSIGGGLFAVVGLPGYMAAANSTAQLFDPNEINSGRALFYFGLIYVVVNGAIFNLIFIAVWQMIVALRRSPKHIERI